MTEISLEVFTSTGSVRRDFTEQEVEALTPERRERFTALLSASVECEAAEVEMNAATAAVANAVTELTRCQLADQAANPPSTFLIELRKVQNRPRE